MSPLLLREEDAARGDPVPARSRSIAIDVARGAAVIAMVIYHTAWDLSVLALAPVDIAASGWRWFARGTAASFLVLVGVGLVLAGRGGSRPRAALLRVGRIAAAAAAVTVATVFAFPDSFIFFGILHNIALSSLLALPFARGGPVPAGIAALAFWFAPLAAGPAFDAPALLFLGLGTAEPTTNDWVPLFPWTGFVFAGIAAGALALPWLRRDAAAPAAGPARHPVARGIAFLGRHSLAIYLAHQPLIFGLLWTVRAILGPNPAAEALPFMRSCVAICHDRDTPEAACRSACGCTVEALRREGVWPAVRSGRASEAEIARARAIAGECRAGAVGPEPPP